MITGLYTVAHVCYCLDFRHWTVGVEIINLDYVPEPAGSYEGDYEALRMNLSLKWCIRFVIDD